MRIGKNVIYIIGLAIFLGAMLLFADLALALFAPVLGIFGGFALVALFIMVFLGAWIMKKGTSPA